MNDIVSIINTAGFPIAMCLALMWYVKSLTETHKSETSEFVEALNKNTLVLQQLCDKLEKED